MKWLSDEAMDRLRAAIDLPDLSDTAYEITGEIARGGMGTVYLAHDKKLHRRVAVKVLNLPYASQEMKTRLLKEARIIARLEHPGIVPVHDAGISSDGRVFYVMKFVQGDSLDRRAKEIASLPDRLRIFQKICEAVSFAHAHGVIHRDLKPQNVMVGPFGEVLVMDWGVAKILRDGENRILNNPPAHFDDATISAQSESVQGTGETAAGTVLGTPAYMSPEQSLGQGDRVDERADVYSLGVILYFLLTDLSPPDSGVIRDIRHKTNAKIPKAIEAVCLKSLSENREDRYESAQALADEVTRFLNGLSVLAYRESAMERAGRFLARNRFIVLLILAYLVMRIIVLFLSGR